jgi:hypothetical protein
MRPWVAVALVCAALPPAASADEPTPRSRKDLCLVPNNLIEGPRVADRPLPLLSGDPSRGFHPACSVPWSTLSPNGKALPVVGCFQGSLLQLPNDAACGPDTGRLWVNSRWVRTRTVPPAPPEQAAACQHLETSAYAASRDYPSSPKCVPRKEELKPRAVAAQPAPARRAPDQTVPREMTPKAADSTPAPDR